MGSAVALLILWAVVDLLRRRTPGVGPMVVGALFYPALVCFTFQPHHRMLLPVLPLYAAWTAYALAGPGRPRVGHAAALALLLWQAGHVPRTLHSFAERHPHAEIAAAQKVADNQPTTILKHRPFQHYDGHPAVITSYPKLSKFVDIPTLNLPGLPRSRRADAGALHSRLLSLAEQSGAGWAVLGRNTLSRVTWKAVTQAPWPQDVEVVSSSATAITLELTDRSPRWIDEAGVRPNPFIESPLELQLTATSADAVKRAMFMADVGDKTTSIQLDHHGDGVYQARLPQVKLRAGSYRLAPCLHLHDGTVVFGRPILLEVP